jgi:hypothetical protein
MSPEGDGINALGQSVSHSFLSDHYQPVLRTAPRPGA